MSYQNVGTPRFYINDLTWGKSLGITTGAGQSSSSLVDGNPSSIVNIGTIDSGDDKTFHYSTVNYDRPNYCAVLGHNFASKNIGFRHYYREEAAGSAWNGGHAVQPIINSTTADWAPGHTQFSFPEYDGFTIVKLTGSANDDYYGKTSFQFGNSTGNPNATDVKVGTVVKGRYYDMPHSPDLSLKLSYDYDGIKTIQTKGGATLSNAAYTKPAMWGDLGAWELKNTSATTQGNYDTRTSRTGRKVWGLSFSYLSDKDIMPHTMSQIPTIFDTENFEPSNDYTGFSNEGGNAWNTNKRWLANNDFYTQVIHKTNGLPFIFQPDGGGDVVGEGNFNPDQFAICRFDMKSFQYNQTAPNLYSVKLKIRECW